MITRTHTRTTRTHAGLRPPSGASAEPEVRRLPAARRGPLPHGEGRRLPRGRPNRGAAAVLPAHLRARGEPPALGHGGQCSAGGVRLPGPERRRRGDRQGGQISGAAAVAGAEPVCGNLQLHVAACCLV